MAAAGKMVSNGTVLEIANDVERLDPLVLSWY